MLKFNNKTGKYEPFKVTPKKFGTLNEKLQASWNQIPAAKDMGLEYKPCCVTLKDGKKVDYVYVVEASAYIQVWGVWPSDDEGKRSLNIENVDDIAESPNRLPVHLARKLYEAGESGMGYTAFTCLFKDGAKQAYLTGNAIDFIKLPEGKTTQDITDVLPHEGRKEHQYQAPEYYWCLFEKK